MSDPYIHNLSQHVLKSYTDAHPELEEFYRTDTVAHEIMTTCAIHGYSPIVMLFHLARAQRSARLEIEQRYLHHLETHPIVTFHSPSPNLIVSPSTQTPSSPAPSSSPSADVAAPPL